MKSYAVRWLVAIVALSASPAIADQAHWWVVARSSSGVFESCGDRRVADGSAASPTKTYERLRVARSYKGFERYQNLRIVEDTAIENVRRVRVVWESAEGKFAISFFQSLEDCQAIAKAEREAKARSKTGNLESAK